MTHDELEQFNDMQKRIEALVFDAKDCVLNTSALIDRIEALEEQLQRYSEDIVGAERLYQKLSGQQQQRDASHNALCDVVCDLIETTVQGDGNDVKLYANASNARVCADDYLKRAEKAETERDAMRECVEVLRDVCREIDIQPDSELFFEGDKAIDKLDALNAKEGV